MSGTIDTIKEKMAALKEIFAALREAILVIVLLLLLILPETFNGILQRAGFTEADFGFIKWKNQLEEVQKQTEEARALVTEIQEELQGLQGELIAAEKTRDGKISPQREITRLSDRMAELTAKTRAARQKLSENLQTQEQLLQEIAKTAPR